MLRKVCSQGRSPSSPAPTFRSEPLTPGTFQPIIGLLPGGIAMTHLSADHAKIAAFCKKHHIRKLSFFGSVVRDDFGPESDVDVLVEFEEGRTPGLSFFAMEEELSSIIGRKVDLNTPRFLSPYFRDEVAAESVTEYAAA